MMTLTEAINEVKQNAPSKSARDRAKSWPRTIGTLKELGWSAEKAKAEYIKHILVSLKDYATGNQECLDCKKIIIRDSEEYKNLLETNKCSCGSPDVDVEYSAWDTPKGKEVIEALEHHQKTLQKKLA